MCFSAEASFTAAAILLPAGAIGMQRAYRTERRYLPFAALPLFFGLQQLFEDLVWTGNALSNGLLGTAVLIGLHVLLFASLARLGSILHILLGVVQAAVPVPDLRHPRRHAWRHPVRPLLCSRRLADHEILPARNQLSGDCAV